MTGRQLVLGAAAVLVAALCGCAKDDNPPPVSPAAGSGTGGGAGSDGATGGDAGSGGSSDGATGGDAGSGSSGRGTGGTDAAGGSGSGGTDNATGGTGGTEMTNGGNGQGDPIVACKKVENPPAHDETGTPNAWQDVTPSSWDDNPDLGGSGNNYGFNDVLVNPCSPNILYAFANYQGMFRSTDYGQTWSKHSESANIESGRPWTAQIDSRGVLYTVAGYGEGGIYRSTDGGVTWKQIVLTVADISWDVYSIAIDPYDDEHLIVSFHGDTQLAESEDGGYTWVARDAGTTVSQYVFFIDTGDESTTRKTWLAINQAHNDADLVFLTMDGGGSWETVLMDGHTHGQANLLKLGDSYYLPLEHGVYRSDDLAASWTQIDTVGATSIAATETRLLVSFGWAFGRQPRTALLADDTAWSNLDPPSSATGDYWGGKRMVATTDGERWYVIGGMWKNGIWRYAEE